MFNFVENCISRGFDAIQRDYQPMKRPRIFCVLLTFMQCMIDACNKQCMQWQMHLHVVAMNIMIMSWLCMWFVRFTIRTNSALAKHTHEYDQ
jgi:hypothetical protein